MPSGYGFGREFVEPLLRVPQPRCCGARREEGPHGSHRTRRSARWRSLHGASRLVRTRVDPRARRRSERPCYPRRRPELAQSSRPCHSLDSRLHRRLLRRTRDTRTGEPRQPSDHVVPGHEDRPDQLLHDDVTRREAVWLGRTRFEVPGPARPNTEPQFRELQVVRFFSGHFGLDPSAILSRHELGLSSSTWRSDYILAF